MSSRIEQIIEEIKDYIDSCKFQPLSTTKIVVNKEELEELLCELRMKTPDEIKRYQKIISNKDSIIQDAKNRAEAEIAEATAKAQQLVSENEVMRMAQEHAEELLERAQKQAQEIIDNATNDANSIRMSAISYTDEMLENLEKIMAHTMETAGAKYETFLNSIQSCYDIVNKNRQELSPQEAPSSYIPEEEDEEEEE
ncbi:MAG: ATPase [Eubacteriales bacterium]|nr:ATPase [Eubacteriales bacterium]